MKSRKLVSRTRPKIFMDPLRGLLRILPSGDNTFKSTNDVFQQLKDIPYPKNLTSKGHKMISSKPQNDLKTPAKYLFRPTE